VKAPPEPLLTLEEACQRYFPGKSACALRWMIKRRGYAHSRWGREYRLTPSQVAAIVEDLARPAQRVLAVAPRSLAAPRRARVSARTAATLVPPPADMPSPGGAARGQAAGRRRLEDRLSAPLSTPPGLPRTGDAE
jgi:hypothetical protein